MSEIPSRETLGGWIDGVRGAGEEVGLPVNASASTLPRSTHLHDGDVEERDEHRQRGQRRQARTESGAHGVRALVDRRDTTPDSRLCGARDGVWHARPHGPEPRSQTPFFDTRMPFIVLQLRQAGEYSRMTITTGWRIFPNSHADAKRRFAAASPPPSLPRSSRRDSFTPVALLLPPRRRLPRRSSPEAPPRAPA